MVAILMTHYYTNDGLGSVRTLTDTSGTLHNKYDYTAFGKSYAPNTAENISQRYTYTGREKTSSPEIMYYRWRMYNSRVGRFVHRDPIYYRGGINLYAYADNNVNYFSDPYGLWESTGAADSTPSSGPGTNLVVLPDSSSTTAAKQEAEAKCKRICGNSGYSKYSLEREWFEPDEEDITGAMPVTETKRENHYRTLSGSLTHSRDMSSGSGRDATDWNYYVKYEIRKIRRYRDYTCYCKKCDSYTSDASLTIRTSDIDSVKEKVDEWWEKGSTYWTKNYSVSELANVRPISYRE